MMKNAWLFLFLAGISCNGDDEVKPEVVVCTFTFAGNSYEATLAKCQYYPYPGTNEVELRNGDKFVLYCGLMNGFENGSVLFKIGDSQQYFTPYASVVFNGSSFKVDAELTDMSNKTGGQLMIDCSCSEGSFKFFK